MTQQTLTFTPSGGAQAAVGLLTAVEGPAPTAEALDITPLDAEGGCRVFARGRADGGEARVTGFYDADDPGQAALRAAYRTGETGAAVITFGDGTGVAFPAFVRSFSVRADGTEGASVFTAILRAAGSAVFTEI